MSGAGCRPPVLLWPETYLPIWVTGALAHSAEGPLFGESNGTFHRLLFTSVEEAAHWPALGRTLGDRLVGGPGGSYVCACVCSASTSMQKVQRSLCSARRQRHGRWSPCLCRAQDAGLEGKARGWAVEYSSSKCLLNTSSWWAVTFPSRPQLLEQKSLGPPHSPASGQS